MPRPTRDGKPSTGDIRAALASLKENQEQSLAAIDALLRSVEDVEAEPRKLEAPGQSMAVKFKTDLVEEQDAKVQLTLPELPGAAKKKPEQKGDSISKLTEKGSKFGSLISGDDADETAESSTVRAWCKWMLNQPQFDWTMGAVIFLNSLAIGIETENSISNEWVPDWPRQELDYVFIVIYVVEISIRLTAYGRSCFKDGWFIFDFSLVCMGVFFIIVDPIIQSMSSESGGDNFLTKILVVRSLRLLRLVRAVRMLHMFRTVWRLVYGLITSGNAIMSTFFILFLTLYIFACLGVELITKDPQLQQHADTKFIVDTNFRNLTSTLLTLIAWVGMDSISAVYFPLIQQNPFLIFYFVPIILMVSVALMNLVTAVLVEGALANAANDKELSRHDMKQTVKKFAPKIMEVFSSIDTDGNGTLEKDELSKIQLSDLPFELSMEQVDNLEDLFDMLDVEGRGEISQVEFADGLLNLLTNDVPIHQMKTFKLLQLSAKGLERVENKLFSMEQILLRRK
ncbi:Cation channel sperm-associated protein 1 [Symbiodinium microadriaticum]|uniref:Cation channel sperm-associated protein 1 n=1 Tax=Symbiodinium microadriaticum TaxID=2951 RepID=A0A1Q9CUX6_SYMMI|nr:Cation channel sperm-associated protein 1 [Symbiodinium microadriaticum]